LVALEYYLLGEGFLCGHADIDGSRFWMPLRSFLRRELPTFENYRESLMMQNIWVGPFYHKQIAYVRFVGPTS